MINSRLLAIGCVSLASAVLAGAADSPPDWLTTFCERTETFAPCRFEVRTSLKTEGNERLSSTASFRSGGGVSYAADVSYDRQTGQRSERSTVTTVDGVEQRWVRGWMPGDSVETPVRPTSKFFRDVRGNLDSVDPASPMIPTAWAKAGVRPLSSVSYSDLFLGRPPDALAFSQTDDGLVRCELAGSRDEPMGLTGAAVTFVGAVFLFDPGREWPLMKYGLGGGQRGWATFGDFRRVGELELPFEKMVEAPYGTTIARVQEIVMPPGCDRVKPLQFPEGMAVLDRRDRSVNYIWGTDGPSVTLDRAALGAYSRRGTPPPPSDAPGQFAGRDPGRGWTSWAVNGLLVATVVALFWLRRRVA